jgi:hypothetical protein
MRNVREMKPITLRAAADALEYAQRPKLQKLK